MNLKANPFEPQTFNLKYQGRNCSKYLNIVVVFQWNMHISNFHLSYWETSST